MLPRPSPQPPTHAVAPNPSNHRHRLVRRNFLQIPLVALLSLGLACFSESSHEPGDPSETSSDPDPTGDTGDAGSTTGDSDTPSDPGGGSDTGGPTNSDGSTTSGDGDTSTDGTDDTDDTNGTGSGTCIPDCDALQCGPDPSCGEICGVCSGVSECLVDGEFCGVRLGWPFDLDSEGEANSGIIFGHKLTVDAPVTVHYFGLLAGVAGGQARMAIYSDDDGPNELLVETASFELLSGENITDTDVAHALGVGDYWLMIQLESVSILKRSEQTTHEIAVDTITWDAGFPQTWTSTSTGNSNQYNLFLLAETN